MAVILVNLGYLENAFVTCDVLIVSLLAKL